MTEKSLRAQIEEIEGHPRNYFNLTASPLRMRANGCMPALPSMITVMSVLLVLFLPNEQLDECALFLCEISE